jgi:pyridoxal phosphate enzyme (YggS family)
MRKAAVRAGREPDAVRLVAVTKAVGLEEARILFELGQADLAENRVQDGQPKVDALPGAKWHLVGPLQTNKVNKVLGRFEWIHSVDRVRLVEFMGKRLKSPMDALVEVNVAGEGQKTGARLEEVKGILEAAVRFPFLNVRGLMTMAPWVPAEQARPVFRELRELLDEANRQAWYSRPMTELSMGMTNDFEVAIEEGATMVRIGTALFEG